MWLVFLLVLGLVIYGIFEYRRHRYYIKRSPVRIHINGTRGKSSVTRLIGGGLKGGGKKVFIKTTGTGPRTIDVEDIEEPIYRVGRANVIEQLKITRQAFFDKADFFVVECMALQPDLQTLTEHQIIRSRVGVITNIREDHLDVMGPTLEDVAESLCNSIPRNGLVFTTEKRFLDIIKRRTSQVGTEVRYIDPGSVSIEDLSGFSYLEHSSNVALSLAVCNHFGVDKKSALEGMYAINPDPGVLRMYSIGINSKSIEFVNAFAANDPESYKAIWEMLDIHRNSQKKLIVLVNSRRDRIQRAEQLGEFIAKELEADFFVVSGEYTHPLVHKAIKCGLPSEMIKDLGGHSVSEIFDFIANLTVEKSMVVGIGNIVGLGEKIVKHFESRGRMVA
jgi:poly-gamma-glutamate synthase PgsB/CapB